MGTRIRIRIATHTRIRMAIPRRQQANMPKTSMIQSVTLRAGVAIQRRSGIITITARRTRTLWKPFPPASSNVN